MSVSDNLQAALEEVVGKVAAEAAIPLVPYKTDLPPMVEKHRFLGTITIDDLDTQVRSQYINLPLRDYVEDRLVLDETKWGKILKSDGSKCSLSDYFKQKWEERLTASTLSANMYWIQDSRGMMHSLEGYVMTKITEQIPIMLEIELKKRGIDTP